MEDRRSCSVVQGSYPQGPEEGRTGSSHVVKQRRLPKVTDSRCFDRGFDQAIKSRVADPRERAGAEVLPGILDKKSYQVRRGRWSSERKSLEHKTQLKVPQYQE